MGFLRDFGLPELLIILVIIVLLFGPGRIGKVAGELGKGIRAFRDGMKPNAEDKDDEQDDMQEKPIETTVEKK
jgi:sec-independent protein translocase protein TatA